MGINRSPVYPIFLNFLKSIFVNNFDIWVILFQILLIIFSIDYLVKKIKNFLLLNPFLLILLIIVLISPCIYSLNIANRFLSEAIAYPLYLLIVSHFLSAYIKDNTKHLLYAFPILFILILTRNQFIFLIPIALLIVLLISFKNKTHKKNWWFYALFILTPLLTNITDKFYHNYKHDYFGVTPWTGVHISSSAFFVSDKQDSSIFINEKEKDFFNSIFEVLEQKKLNINYIDEDNQDETAYFLKHFNHITNFTLSDQGKNMMGDSLSENEKYVALDILTKKMAPKLIKDNFSFWLKVYLKNFINAFGNIKYTFIYFIILIFCLIHLKNSNTNKVKFFFLGILLTLSNVAIICIGSETIPRLTFYNDWILFLIIFILLELLINSKVNFNKISSKGK